MDDEDLFSIREEFLEFVRLEYLTRQDRKLAKAKPEELGPKGPTCGVVLMLIFSVQAEMKDAIASIREECLAHDPGSVVPACRPLPA